MKKRQLRLIVLKLAKPPNLKHARLCCDHFLEGDYYPNYKMQLEITGRSGRSVFSVNLKGSREIEARP